MPYNQKVGLSANRRFEAVTLIHGQKRRFQARDVDIR
jgi:hypothetical protein